MLMQIEVLPRIVIQTARIIRADTVLEIATTVIFFYLAYMEDHTSTKLLVGKNLSAIPN